MHLNFDPRAWNCGKRCRFEQYATFNKFKSLD